MKTLFAYPVLIYVAAALACLCIMIIIDFFLGAEAEHLNAWVILNRLLGRDPGVGDSLAIRHLGLAGATALMLLANTLFGAVLLQLVRLIIRLFHS